MVYRDRISTIVKKRNFDDETEETAGDTWTFPVGWNRHLVDPVTGFPTSEPLDPRFLSNSI